MSYVESVVFRVRAAVVTLYEDGRASWYGDVSEGALDVTVEEITTEVVALHPGAVSLGETASGNGHYGAWFAWPAMDAAALFNAVQTVLCAAERWKKLHGEAACWRKLYGEAAEDLDAWRTWVWDQGLTRPGTSIPVRWRRRKPAMTLVPAARDAALHAAVRRLRVEWGSAGAWPHESTPGDARAVEAALCALEALLS